MYCHNDSKVPFSLSVHRNERNGDARLQCMRQCHVIMNSCDHKGSSDSVPAAGRHVSVRGHHPALTMGTLSVQKEVGSQCLRADRTCLCTSMFCFACPPLRTKLGTKVLAMASVAGPAGAPAFCTFTVGSACAHWLSAWWPVSPVAKDGLGVSHPSHAVGRHEFMLLSSWRCILLRCQSAVYFCVEET